MINDLPQRSVLTSVSLQIDNKDMHVITGGVYILIAIA